ASLWYKPSQKTRMSVIFLVEFLRRKLRAFFGFKRLCTPFCHFDRREKSCLFRTTERFLPPVEMTICSSDSLRQQHWGWVVGGGYSMLDGGCSIPNAPYHLSFIQSVMDGGQ
ncbi:MAG: hypothetical protein WAW37_05230, partial [Syntrophobacteraceae bacterium]